jgi:hypothetical protein
MKLAKKSPGRLAPPADSVPDLPGDRGWRVLDREESLRLQSRVKVRAKQCYFNARRAIRRLEDYETPLLDEPELRVEWTREFRDLSPSVGGLTSSLDV